MKKILLLIIFFLSCFCVYSADVPEWIFNPLSICSSTEICSVGSGSSAISAKIDAKNGIIKYFETNINSKYSSSSSTDEISVKEIKSENMEELSSGILKGTSITKTYTDGSNYYAFAVLDKDIASKEIESDIKKIDARMKLLLSENSIQYNGQLERLYKQRDNLNKRYLLLTEELIPEEIKYEDIFKNNKNSSLSSSIYYFEPTYGFARQVSDNISSKFTENGAKLSNNPKTAEKIVEIIVNKRDLYLNVKGFMKQMYSLKIVISDLNDNILVNLHKEFTETGRSETQIQEIVNMNIKTYVEENIENLLK